MAKILFYDIETAPIVGTTWGKYEQNLIWIIEDWYMLCFAYKWLDEKKTHVVALPDFKGYIPGEANDLPLIQKLHELFSEADVVVAHNGDSFDQKKSQARMVKHNMSPPTPYRQLDTKKIAKRYFNFTSNKLDDLGVYLGVGKKLKTDADLWKFCMAGDKKAWDKMKKYNKQDVILLEKIYLKFRPWVNSHPALNVLDGRPKSCNKCGSNRMNKSMKYLATNTNLYQYYRCQKCGGMAKSRVPIKGTEKPNYV